MARYLPVLVLFLATSEMANCRCAPDQPAKPQVAEAPKLDSESINRGTQLMWDRLSVCLAKQKGSGCTTGSQLKFEVIVQEGTGHLDLVSVAPIGSLPGELEQCLREDFKEARFRGTGSSGSVLVTFPLLCDAQGRVAKRPPSTSVTLKAPGPSAP